MWLSYNTWHHRPWSKSVQVIAYLLAWHCSNPCWPMVIWTRGTNCSEVSIKNIFISGWETKIFWHSPNWVVSYIAYTKFHLPRPVSHSPGQIFIRIGERVSASFQPAFRKMHSQMMTISFRPQCANCLFWLTTKNTSRDWFNVKMLSYQYRNFHCGDFMTISTIGFPIVVRHHFYIETGSW